MSEPSEQLDEMIHMTPVVAAAAAADYSFPKDSSSSSSEEDKEPSEIKRKRPRSHPPPPPPPQEDLSYYEEEEEERSGLKTLGALLVVLFIVAGVVAVIGYTTWRTSHYSKHKTPLAPLWTEQHVTLSEPVNPVYSRALLPDIERILSHYLLESPRHFPCLCMHHLQYPWSLEYPLSQYALALKLNGQPHSYQVCGVASFPTQEVILLVNPTLQGRGNISDTYTERSVSCPNGSVQQRQRFRTIFLEWQDIDEQMVWARFEGPVAACLQLALDEMLLGNKHC